MDGVWLPAGEETAAARGFPDSRHTPRSGIAKGEAFSPVTRRRSPEVNKTPASARRNRIKRVPESQIAISIETGSSNSSIAQPVTR